MSIPAINLNALEYEDIYDSIKTYISGKTEFTDYDFSGSGLSTILDLLTYNTYYQLIFQNSLGNEMFIDSLSSMAFCTQTLYYTKDRV